MYGHGMVHGPDMRHFLASVTLERSLEQSLAWVTFWNGTPCGILWNTLWNTPRDTLREHDVSRPFVTAMKDWLCFLGYYMAAGGIEKKDDSFTRVTFNTSLMSPGAPERLESYIRRIGFEPEVVENEIVVKSTQLATHVAWCGWTRTKAVPKDILGLSPEYLRVLLDAMVEGQGGGRSFTFSNMLSWNFQELCAKIGLAANDNVILKPGEASDIPGFESEKLWSDLHGLDVVDASECRPVLESSDIHDVEYDGMAYCVEVPGHVVYVRCNGKPAWCGNSVSISKGGRVAKLNARTSVLAIANPLHGRYDANKYLPENIPSIPPTMLSRFDRTYSGPRLIQARII